MGYSSEETGSWSLRPFESACFRHCTLHSSHQGIESTLRRARETVYWPNMKSDIKISPQSAKRVHPTAQDSRRRRSSVMTFQIALGQKISTDLFDLDRKRYMVTVDYFSGFFEIDRLYDLKVSTVIRKLKTHMARYGIPDEVVSDSGSQYTSREFKNSPRNTVQSRNNKSLPPSVQW